MQRANIFAIEPTRKQNQMLEYLADNSAILWNKINYERRQKIFKNERIDWNRSLYSDFSSSIGSAVSQQVIRKNDEAWRSFFVLLKLKKEGNLPPMIEKVKPPSYWKDRNSGKRKHIIIERNDMYHVRGEYLYVPASKKLKKIYSIKGFIKLKLKGKLKWKGKQGRIEIIFDSLKGKWYCYQSVKVEKPRHQIKKKKAYVDLGVVNLITAITPESAVIYSGRNILAEWWYWTNRIALHESELMRVNKKHTSKQLSKLYRIRKRRFRHSINAMVKDFAEICKREKIGEVVVGDVKDIRHNCGRGQKGRKTRTLVNNFWSFAFVKQRLKDKLEEYGIKIRFVNEAYTSRTCPKCGHRTKSNRKHRGLFICKKCEYTQNADIVGAMNMRINDNRKNSDNWLVAQPSLSRWNYAIWE
jgi:putative transposase